MLETLRDELRRQQRDAVVRLASARRDGDPYLVEAMTARLEELAFIARRHGLQPVA